jgi:hypothetical protein
MIAEAEAEAEAEATVDGTPGHLCVAGRGCRDAKMIDGEKLPALTELPDTVCDACRASIEWAIGDIADIWHALHAAIGDQSRRTSQKVAGSRSAPINVNSDVDAAKAAILEWLVAGAARVAELVNVDDPRPANNTDREHARVVQACARLIAPNLDRLLDLGADDIMIWLPASETDTPGESLPYTTETGQRAYRTNVDIVHMTGAELALKLRSVHGAARSLLLLTEPADKLGIPCPRCNEYELTRTHRVINTVGGKAKEIDDIDCGACKLSWPYQQYRNLCEIWVRKDEMEREKLQEQLDEERQRRELAEWLLAQREWQLSLGLECTDVVAADFVKTILERPEPPNLDDHMSDKDIATIVGVAPATIRKWASQGHIERHTADDGSTTFLAREVWDHSRTNNGGRASTRRITNERRAAS